MERNYYDHVNNAGVRQYPICKGISDRKMLHRRFSFIRFKTCKSNSPKGQKVMNGAQPSHSESSDTSRTAKMPKWVDFSPFWWEWLNFVTFDHIFNFNSILTNLNRITEIEHTSERSSMVRSVLTIFLPLQILLVFRKRKTDNLESGENYTIKKIHLKYGFVGEDFLTRFTFFLFRGRGAGSSLLISYPKVSKWPNHKRSFNSDYIPAQDWLSKEIPVYKGFIHNGFI